METEALTVAPPENEPLLPGSVRAMRILECCDRDHSGGDNTVEQDVVEAAVGTTFR